MHQNLRRFVTACAILGSVVLLFACSSEEPTEESGAMEQSMGGAPPAGSAETAPEPTAAPMAAHEPTAAKAAMADDPGRGDEGAMKMAAPASDGPSAPEAYVDTTALNVRSGPGTSHGVVGILLKYDPVSVTGSKGAWYSIEAAGGHVDGWVSGSFLKFGPAPGSSMEKDLDYGAPETPTLVRGSFKYLGVNGCKGCHLVSTGKHDEGAHKVWKGHFHSEAFRSLGRNYTTEISQRMRGVEDPTSDWRCVKCHVTAYGAAPEQLADSYSEAEGVGCEVCHGPGSEYAKVDHGPSNPERYDLGFVKLTNLAEREQLCVKCHNPLSPTYKPFNVLAFSRAIQHWPDASDETYFQHAEEASKAREEALAKQQAEDARRVAAERLAREAEAEAKKAAAAEAQKAEEMAAMKAAADAEAEKAEEMARKAAEEAAQAEATQKAALEAEAQKAAEKAELEAEEAARAAEAAAAAEADKVAKEAAAREQAEQDRQARLEEEAKKAEAERLAAEEAAREKAAAEAAAQLEALAKAKAEEEKRQAAIAAEQQQAASSASGVESYLEDVDAVLLLNPSGKKYGKVKFTHAAHASSKYAKGVQCATCHHTQEGDDAPEPCSDCHAIDGDAGETKAKTKAAHSKSNPFPKEPDQEATSCIGCHKSQNALLSSGGRSGKKAPTKCTGCHPKKSS